MENICKVAVKFFSKQSPKTKTQFYKVGLLNWLLYIVVVINDVTGRFIGGDLKWLPHVTVRL